MKETVLGKNGVLITEVSSLNLDVHERIFL